MCISECFYIHKRTDINIFVYTLSVPLSYIYTLSCACALISIYTYSWIYTCIFLCFYTYMVYVFYVLYILFAVSPFAKKSIMLDSPVSQTVEPSLLTASCGAFFFTRESVNVHSIDYFFSTLAHRPFEHMLSPFVNTFLIFKHVSPYTSHLQ